MPKLPHPEDLPHPEEPPHREEPPQPEPRFRPFADDAAVLTFGDLSIENGTVRIAIHGSAEITRDRMGLERAIGLKAALDSIIEALWAQELPEAVSDEARAAERVRNPFT